MTQLRRKYNSVQIQRHLNNTTWFPCFLRNIPKLENSQSMFFPLRYSYETRKILVVEIDSPLRNCVRLKMISKCSARFCFEKSFLISFKFRSLTKSFDSFWLVASGTLHEISLFCISLETTNVRRWLVTPVINLVALFRQGNAAEGESATRRDMLQRRDNIVPRLWYVIMIMTCFLCALMLVDILIWGKKKLTANQ